MCGEEVTETLDEWVERMNREDPGGKNGPRGPHMTGVKTEHGIEWVEVGKEDTVPGVLPW